MKINHTAVHYVIGGVALALAGSATIASHQPVTHQTQIVQQGERHNRHDWQALGEDKTIALGEALKGAAPGKAMIFCDEPACRSLTLDIDDALQIADWKSAFEARPVDSEGDQGISVGPPGPQAENLASTLRKIMGVEVKIVPIDDLDGGVGIIIGKSGN